MPVGQGALLGGMSYVALGRETTAGTYNTCTALLPCLSFGLVAMKENKILEQIETSRTYSLRTGQMKKVQGDASFYFQPQRAACTFLLHNAFIGTVTSATATGETVGAGASSAIDHTFNIGSTYQSFGSLCINSRKGDSSAGKVFQYVGVRVNELSFSGEINEALKCNAALIGMDVTQASNDVYTTTALTSTAVLNFADGRLSVENNFASLTSSSFWHVQSVEFSMNNNLKADAASGRIGSDILTVLPPGMATFGLKCKIRFDTTTAWDAMMAGSTLTAQFNFNGPTMSGSNIRQKLQLNFPHLIVHSAGEPQIGGPNEILTSDVEFHVLRDASSSGGYAVQGIVTNQQASGAFS